MTSSSFDVSKMTLADATKMSQMLKAFAATALIGTGESMPNMQTPESADVYEIEVLGGKHSDSQPSGVFKRLMNAYKKSITMADAAEADVQLTANATYTKAGLYTPK